MIEALLIIAGGLVGSGHCIGMCGGFALTLGSHAATARRNLLRQLVYGLGRVSVYVLLGAFVGFGSWQLGRNGFGFAAVQASLSVIAGIFLIAEGLFSTGLVPRPFAKKAGCPGVNLFATLLRAPNLTSVFVGGLLNGLLPCGLVYAYLALAASAGNLVAGGAVMALFGLGTLPALIVTGMTGYLLSQVWRLRIFRIAACCMILTGVLSLWRGAVAFHTMGTEEAACPWCNEE